MCKLYDIKDDHAKYIVEWFTILYHHLVAKAQLYFFVFLSHTSTVALLGCIMTLAISTFPPLSLLALSITKNYLCFQRLHCKHSARSGAYQSFGSTSEISNMYTRTLYVQWNHISEIAEPRVRSKFASTVESRLGDPSLVRSNIVRTVKSNLGYNWPSGVLELCNYSAIELRRSLNFFPASSANLFHIASWRAAYAWCPRRPSRADCASLSFHCFAWCKNVSTVHSISSGSKVNSSCHRSRLAFALSHATL